MPYSIAIDGPAGAGKSTIARMTAEKLGYIYVDTGAMYRAMALFLIRNNIAADDNEAVSRECRNADISIEYRDGEQVVLLGGQNVNPYLRTGEVSNMASVSSTNADVRVKLVELQRKLAEKANVVMDGRDIGTVVLPHAQCKIYLTASVAVRAKRRFDEIIEKGGEADIETISREIEERDYRDMHRANSPLKQAEDAIYLDTSDLTIDEVTEKIMDIVKQKGIL
ncbi:MAG: (d)CMP kinase [Lachnospiraceae bacterium]|jgi:cytidylate kinase|nr:(d)CMP kinase [Lachnospiraceae bacterium]